MTLYLSRNLKAHFSPRNSSLHSMSALCSAQVSARSTGLAAMKESCIGLQAAARSNVKTEPAS